MIPRRYEAAYEIIHLSEDGRDANLAMKDTNLERSRVPMGEMTVKRSMILPQPPRDKDGKCRCSTGLHLELQVTGTCE